MIIPFTIVGKRKVTTRSIPHSSSTCVNAICCNGKYKVHIEIRNIREMIRTFVYMTFILQCDENLQAHCSLMQGSVSKVEP